MRWIGITALILCMLVCGVTAEEIITDFDVVFNTSGVYTWTCPDGLESIDVVVIGGGGAGASGGHRTGGRAYGGGGGGAGTAEVLRITNDGDQFTHGPGGLEPGVIWYCEVGAYGYADTYTGREGSGSLFSSDYGAIYANGGNGGAHLASHDRDGLNGADGYVSITPFHIAGAGASDIDYTGGSGGNGAGAGGGGGASNAGDDSGPDYLQGGNGACGAIAIKYNYPYTPPKPASTIQWSPETGYYTSYWFNRDADFINVEGLFSAILLPFTALIGQWFFMIVWGTLVMGIYLHSQDTTLPFVIGILLGAVISLSAGADGVTVMYLTMAFAGGGVLAKVLLGRL